ncbi:MAG: hypothetical protein H0U65_14955 [Rubrobacter sp.]|nr:hypothetical protein [Rubrobacter sp.]
MAKDENEPISLAHTFLKPGAVEAEIAKLPPEVLDGRDREAFVREMARRWQYGKQRMYSDGDRPRGWFSFLGRSHLPERLWPGLGGYEAAILRGYGPDTEIDFHESEALARIEWSRIFVEEDGVVDMAANHNREPKD